MSHVDDGTLHAYLDGELAPAEAQGVDAHLAQCPPCRGRLEEERALITRAGELLALAAPPHREAPPFRAGDVTPPARLWWRVRLPLAWAATVVLALGIGTYLGRGVDRASQAQVAPDTQPTGRRALEPPVSSELAQRESRDKARGAARTPPAAQPVTPAPAPVAQRIADAVEPRADTATPRAYVETGAESEARVSERRRLEDAGDLWQKGSAISIDSARRVLGADPLAVPGIPIEAIYRGRRIGYSGVVIVEQALDSSTMIEVINARSAPLALAEVVVTGAEKPTAPADSMRAPERAPEAGQRATDSLAALNRRRAALPLASAKAADRPSSGLFLEVRGPLSQDSLAALRRLLQSLRP
jgi:hypothetical protein